MSYLATTYFGAKQNRSETVIKWAEPIANAYIAGCWILYWTDDTLFWVAKPTINKEAGTLHHADGPALVCDVGDICFWKGVHIPSEWIMDRPKLTPEIALQWTNVEQRRAACEILGWKEILTALDATTIDADGDPEVGTLVEVNLPDSGKERFLRVMCGTKREFALPVPPTMRTALQAQAWTWGLDEKSFIKPEVRT